jgi:hypothetical protein
MPCGFKESRNFAGVAGNSRSVPSGKKCAHKTKLREEPAARRPYIKCGEGFMTMQWSVKFTKQQVGFYVANSLTRKAKGG